MTLRCRQISETDITAVAALLARGFPRRNVDFWLQALAQLTARQPPPDLPKYGYLLENDGIAVGAVLLLFATIRVGEATAVRCNLSSWCVDPEYRVYAPLLALHAVRHKGATYLNVSPALHTEAIIEALGFERYCEGAFIAAPMLHRLFGAKVRVFSATREPDVDFDPLERKLLLEHARHGALSLWCATAEYAYPFVFRVRQLKRIIPCAQLIYCRDEKEFVRFAGSIGRFLALRGKPFVLVNANGSVPGLVGKYFRGVSPKYFTGPHRPSLCDLAYTESALLGIW